MSIHVSIESYINSVVVKGYAVLTSEVIGVCRGMRPRWGSLIRARSVRVELCVVLISMYTCVDWRAVGAV